MHSCAHMCAITLYYLDGMSFSLKAPKVIVFRLLHKNAGTSYEAGILQLSLTQEELKSKLLIIPLLNLYERNVPMKYNRASFNTHNFHTARRSLFPPANHLRIFFFSASTSKL